MALPPGVQIVIGLLLASVTMTVLWLVQRKTVNAGIVDVGWAAGIGVLGLLFAFTSDGYATRRVLVGTMIGIWSLRLAVHLLTDRVIGHQDFVRTIFLQFSGDSFYAGTDDHSG